MCLMMQSLAVNMVRTMMKNIAHALMTNIRMQGNSKEKIKMMRMRINGVGVQKRLVIGPRNRKAKAKAKA